MTHIFVGHNWIATVYHVYKCQSWLTIKNMVSGLFVFCTVATGCWSPTQQLPLPSRWKSWCYRSPMFSIQLNFSTLFTKAFYAISLFVSRVQPLMKVRISQTSYLINLIKYMYFRWDTINKIKQ